jgi:hypothetical protein
MKRYAAVLTTLFLTAATPTWQPDVAARKCQLPGAPILFPDAPEDVYVLNGRETSPEDMKLVNKKDFESIEMVCPVQLHQVFGVKARRTGVVIFTTPGPHAAIKSAIADVTARQERHFATHGAFARTLEQLGWSDSTGMITMKLELFQEGRRWLATADHKYRINLPNETAGGFNAAAKMP